MNMRRREGQGIASFASLVNCRWQASGLWIVLGIMSAAGVFAESPEEKGMAIAIEADRRDQGFHDSTADLEMILRNRQGQESRRTLHSKSLEQEDDGDKGLVIFNSPADIDGTALLTFSHKTGDDDQWLYLPALKRVKRISSSNKSGPFVGSEFAYEDLSSQEVEEYTYRFKQNETVQGRDMFVVEFYPVDPRSGYTKQTVWLDQQEYRVWRIDYFDRKDALLKTLTFSGYQRYLDKFWRSDVMEMINHQTGKSTELIWKNYQFQTGLEEGDFDRASLARAR
jgi:hypothetical protein